MQYQHHDNPSEESRLYGKDQEASSEVIQEKLNTFWYVIFKYWMLLAALWGLKNLISPSSSDVNREINVKVEYGTFDNILHYINGYPSQIWEVFNCALVFEGLRRKSLKILLKVITSMEAYMVVHMVITFFKLTSDAGLTIAKALFEKRFPDANVEVGKGFLSFFAVIIVLVWASYYYFANIYGAKKAQDVLKGHKK